MNPRFRTITLTNHPCSRKINVPKLVALIKEGIPDINDREYILFHLRLKLKECDSFETALSLIKNQIQINASKKNTKLARQIENLVHPSGLIIALYREVPEKLEEYWNATNEMRCRLASHLMSEQKLAQQQYEQLYLLCDALLPCVREHYKPEMAEPFPLAPRSKMSFLDRLEQQHLAKKVQSKNEQDCPEKNLLSQTFKM